MSTRTPHDLVAEIGAHLKHVHDLADELEQKCHCSIDRQMLFVEVSTHWPRTELTQAETLKILLESTIEQDACRG